MVSLGPFVKRVGTRISGWNERLTEARYAGHKHAGVNDGPGLAFPSFVPRR